MNIKINNPDPLYAPFHLQVPRSDCHIVKIAKSHGFVVLSMMSRRSYGTESIVQLADHNQLCGIEDATYGQQRCFKSFSAHLVVRIVKHRLTRETGRLKTLDIIVVMDGLDPL